MKVFFFRNFNIAQAAIWKEREEAAKTKGEILSSKPRRQNVMEIFLAQNSSKHQILHAIIVVNLVAHDERQNI